MSDSSADNRSRSVRIPTRARHDADDVLPDTRALLQNLYLLPDKDEMVAAGKPSAMFGGPPQSVALIEAGATALSKWWAAGLGASVLGLWPAILAFWDDQPEPNRRVILVAASIATAAAILAIGYIIGSDVRGRSAAAVATIEARTKVADTMLRLAEDAYRPPDSDAPSQIVALPAPLDVRLAEKKGENDELGWKAIAMAVGTQNATSYRVVKGADQEWVDSARVEFVSETEQPVE
jgi:hypothetical protein